MNFQLDEDRRMLADALGRYLSEQYSTDYRNKAAYGAQGFSADTYAKLAELSNEGARDLGFKDTGALWRSNYDMDPDKFAAETDRLWSQVEPFYRNLHCYVRGQLNDTMKLLGRRAHALDSDRLREPLRQRKTDRCHDTRHAEILVMLGFVRGDARVFRSTLPPAACRCDLWAASASSTRAGGSLGCTDLVLEAQFRPGLDRPTKVVRRVAGVDLARTARRWRG